MDTMGLSDTHDIRSLPDLLYAISRARSNEDRLRIFTRAEYLGLGYKVPREWNIDGSVRESVCDVYYRD